MKTIQLLPATFSILLYGVSSYLPAASINDVQQKVIDAQKNSASIQAQIDELHSDELTLDRQYRIMLTELKALSLENEKLKKRIDRQASGIDSLNSQLESVSQVDIEINPLMMQMSSALSSFIAEDLPFLKEQRLDDLKALETVLADIEIDLGDKYLRLLEAFGKESEYGQSIRVYQSSIDINGIATQVNFYQLGRVALYYQTLDAENSAVWLSDTKQWLPLNSLDNESLAKAISLADGVAIPTLLSLPFPELTQENRSNAPISSSVNEGIL